MRKLVCNDHGLTQRLTKSTQSNTPRGLQLDRYIENSLLGGEVSRTCHEPSCLRIVTLEYVDFLRQFAYPDAGSTQSEVEWKPHDAPDVEYGDLDWIQPSKLIYRWATSDRRNDTMSEGQSKALSKCTTNWAINSMGTMTQVTKMSTSGELYRDMAAVVADLRKEDTTITRPHLLGPRAKPDPTIEEFLHVHQQGGKSLIKDKFRVSLAIYAAADISNMDKLITIPGSPLRAKLARFMQSGLGIEVFATKCWDAIVLSQCHELWKLGLRDMYIFIKHTMGDVPMRHFDAELHEHLAKIQPRNVANVQSLFWVVKGIDCDITPIRCYKRNAGIPRYVDHEAYVAVFHQLCQPWSLKFSLRTKKARSAFNKHNIPATRSVMPQLLRWLVPAAEASPDTKGGRWQVKRDYRDIIVEGFFAHEGYRFATAAADNLMRLVEEIISKYINNFSPALSPSSNNYPTI